MKSCCHFLSAGLAAVLLALAPGLGRAQTASGSAAPRYAPDVPAKITTPDTVETRIGTLRFKDGAPDAPTVQLLRDQLDFTRGIDAFLKGISATSVHAICRGLDEAGVKPNGGIGIAEDLLDARSLFLTANTTTVYTLFCLDLNAGPMVVRVPPRVLGPADDADFRWVTDVGLTGPDQGRGGTYLFVPPGYTGPLPKMGFHIAKPRTNRIVVFYRAFVEKGDIAAAVAGVKAEAAVFPLAEAAKPPATTFVNLSGVRFNTISANDFSFFEELNSVVQNEPANWVDPDEVGLYAAIGIRKGQPFAPDARLKAILTDSVAVANGIARADLFASRDPAAKIYTDRQWLTAFIGGSYRFLDGAARLLDARTLFFYYATGITPAMTQAQPGTGSAYAVGLRDAKGEYLDGARTYSVTLPGPVPVNAFWAFTAYDNNTRSLLPTDQKLAGVDSTLPNLKKNADGGATVWFGPTAPAGHEGNWVQTLPGKGYNVLLRLYGPLEPWFDQSWRPGDFEPQP
ncbi:hypothetical protein FHS55_003268 [Angulomicrobium tetraedrale]|uniref:DUF1254 domain-containing protein n=1 Tax=Ancylobacter tetraedralis TaxID=217068 RepID=A0A839ZD81_9HYPH|nr:DUF1254 domain-containing protein [Ancylobacter tetraedralis]MBB3772647.1 hypothetical protein [Ancylobacter tetraedralis]